MPRAPGETSRSDLDIRTADVGQRTSSLSGGNQQKAYSQMANHEAKAIIFDEPTRVSTWERRRKSIA
jgi:ABC-type sugar transport system ATPase subunit